MVRCSGCFAAKGKSRIECTQKVVAHEMKLYGLQNKLKLTSCRNKERKEHTRSSACGVTIISAVCVLRVLSWKCEILI